MLCGFIKNIAINLTPGGRFVAINLSPDHPIVSPGENLSHSSKWLDDPFKDGARIEVKLWTQTNEEICILTDYYWSKQTYEESLTHAGFENTKWIEVRMHEEGKKIANWKELERNTMLVIIKAAKMMD